MARKHRRRHRRGFGDYVSIPSFGEIKDYNPLGKSVKSTDVLVGAALAMAGGSVVKMIVNSLNANTITQERPKGIIPAAVLSYLPPLSTLAAGALLFMFQQKKNKGRATGHFVGAFLAAAAPVYWTTLQKYGPKMKDGTPFFNDYVTVSPYGLLTQDGGMGGYGVLTADGAMGAADEDYPDVLSAP